VYEDELGGDDVSTDTAGGDQLTVEIDGESYEVEENVDLDGDGVYDTAVVRTADGYLAFADTDADGVADVAVGIDQDGNLVAAADYDQTTGEWTSDTTTSASDDAWVDDGGTMYSNDATDVRVSTTADGSEGYIATCDGTTVLTDGSGGVYVSTDDHSWST
jgi:hypothetical protein